jgi:ribosomal protein S12 methylthiotransferase accessory factor
MNFSEEQYRNREEWNARNLTFQVTPDPFEEEADIDWAPVWSLSRDEVRHVPASYCYFSYPTPPDQFFAWADSSGNASGNTLEEAILQGFFELVERDGVCLWWYNRLRRPAVDLASFGEPYLEKYLDYYRSIHREVWVLDITSDLEIPTFAAVSRRVDKEVEDILFAFGAHFDPKIALLRSLTEMNQFLPAVLPIGPTGQGEYAFKDECAVSWWKTATVADQPYLAPEDNLPAMRASDYPVVVNDDLLADIAICRERIENRGMEMLVLDQTRPDIGLNVVKVMVPGLRHFWARFGPGRLYDVPVRMGWLDDPTKEPDLNPIPIFI